MGVMDPNAALKEIRELIEAIDREDDYEKLQTLAVELATVVEGLDGWLSQGGFLPAAWADVRGQG